MTQKTIDIFDSDGKPCIHEHPKHYQMCLKCSVLVIHGRFLWDLFYVKLGHGTVYGVLEYSIQVFLHMLYILHHKSSYICSVSCATAAHIMQITECINVENVGEAGSQTQVLEETGKHVPGITLHRLVSEVDILYNGVWLM
jgi:hypothetical protein